MKTINSACGYPNLCCVPPTVVPPVDYIRRTTTELCSWGSFSGAGYTRKFDENGSYTTGDCTVYSKTIKKYVDGPYAGQTIWTRTREEDEDFFPEDCPPLCPYDPCQSAPVKAKFVYTGIPDNLSWQVEYIFQDNVSRTCDPCIYSPPFPPEDFDAVWRTPPDLGTIDPPSRVGCYANFGDFPTNITYAGIINQQGFGNYGDVIALSYDFSLNGNIDSATSEFKIVHGIPPTCYLKIWFKKITTVYDFETEPDCTPTSGAGCSCAQFITGEVDTFVSDTIVYEWDGTSTNFGNGMCLIDDKAPQDEWVIGLQPVGNLCKNRIFSDPISVGIENVGGLSSSVVVLSKFSCVKGYEPDDVDESPRCKPDGFPAPLPVECGGYPPPPEYQE